MLLAYEPSEVAALRTPTASDPWRVLLSGCLAAWPCGTDGTDNGMGEVLRELLALPNIRALPFCPEQLTLGTPRSMPDIHGGDGVDVIEGQAKVLDQHGNDLTEAMLAGAQAMLAHAQEVRADLAILTDMSAACASQIISDGCRLVAERRYRKGVGVAAAMLLRAGIAVVSQRDHRTLALLRERLQAGYAVPPEARDHHHHPWTLEHLPAPHPRLVVFKRHSKSGR